MPYTDHEKKLDRMRDWRNERTHEYHQWLYQRRMLRRNQADIYAQTLTLIASGEYSLPAEDLAADSLEVATNLERMIGNRFNHVENKPYYKED